MIDATTGGIGVASMRGVGGIRSVTAACSARRKRNTQRNTLRGTFGGFLHRQLPANLSEVEVHFSYVP